MPVTVWLLALVLAAALATSGCAALVLPVVGAAAVSAGAGGAVKAGTEYTMGGTAYRTFTVPVDQVHDVALVTLKRLGIKVHEEERHERGAATIRGRAYDRGVELTLEPVTPSMTQIQLAVRRGLGKDRATASEIIAQMERALEPAPPAAIRAR